MEEVAAKYKVQIGLEYSVNDKDLLPITLDFSPTNVEAVLGQLTSQKAQYTWSFLDGVYDVYPKAGLDSILDVKIREFSVKNVSSKDAADLVGQIPEIKKWLVTRRVSKRELQSGPSVQSSDRLITLSLKNVTFRSLLNRLVHEFGIVDWVVERYGDRQEFIGIYF